MGSPPFDGTSSTFTCVTFSCIHSPLLDFLIFGRIQPDHQSGIAANMLGTDPFHLVDQRFNQKHSHPARLFLLMHFLVNVGSCAAVLGALSGVHHSDLKMVFP